MKVGYSVLMAGLMLAAGHACGADGKQAPVPVNPYAGMQQREEVYEFTQKPAVKKDPSTSSGQAGKWVITFASKANCDATIAVLDKDAKVIRHLASGVLGKNAPWPFQPACNAERSTAGRQNSLSQKVEWDGQDDMGNAVSAEALKGCKVKVSLGLRAKFERNIGWEPANFPGSLPPQEQNWQAELKDYVVGKGQDGSVYVLGYSGLKIITGGNIQGRVYKDGKYVRTFWPPPAKDIEKLPQLGFKLATTIWGDKVWVTGGASSSRYGTGTMRPPKAGGAKAVEDVTKQIFDLVGVTGQTVGAWPAEVPGHDIRSTFFKLFQGHIHRLAADRSRDEVYIGGGWLPGLRRIDGKTGELDKTWFPDGELDKVSEVCVGPDGYVYLGVGCMGYNQFILRLDREGRPVPFTGKGAVPLPKGGGAKWEGGGGQYGELEGKAVGSERMSPNALAKTEIRALWTGSVGHSNVHERGLHVSPRGDIVAAIWEPYAGERAARYGIPIEGAYKRAGGADAPIVAGSFVAVWDNDGNLLTLNAVGNTMNGHGVAMDRDRNIYAVWGGRAPADCKNLVGLTGVPLDGDFWGGFGTLAKFRGGIPYPRSKVGSSEGLPAGAVKINQIGKLPAAVEPVEDSLLWTYTGVIGQTYGPCSCHHLRYDMDYYGRHWLPANYLYSIMVIDANANIVARLGRYGNVDDTEEDVKAGKDGLRFVWPRTVAVSDTALYVNDHSARRILKAALSYAAEETVAVP